MNKSYRSIRNSSTGAVVAVAEITRTGGKRKLRGQGPSGFARRALSGALLLALAGGAYAQSASPTGGVVTAGGATITNTGPVTTINQSTGNVAINWQDFSIGAGNTVQFIQPGANSVALNRVIGADPSVILGSLKSNGNVFLLNPNGVLFGQGASVNVGGLVASTMNLSDADLMAGNYAFGNAGNGSVVNNGSITARDGGYVALMGKTVSNQGVIAAQLGTVALAAGNAATLDVVGDGLLRVSVAEGAMNALVENGGMIQANGGQVLLTAQAAAGLFDTTVNNTGVIHAQTLENRGGTILLLGDMKAGTVNVGGTLDASAPGGGNGGFIETSAATVNVARDVRVTTAAPAGQTGQWLIDPQDFTIGSATGDNIAGSTLSAQLVTNNITISTAGAGTDNGDIFVNDAVSWSASGGPTTLTLLADRNVEINAAITATNGNLAVCCGQDINVNAAITTTNGSVLLAAGRDVNQNAAITVTDGNLLMCAGNDVNIAGAISLTRGTLDPTRSLGLPEGLTLSADTDGTGPGIEGGTVTFAPLTPQAAVVVAPVRIYYNPVSYTLPTDYSTQFTLTEGAALSQYMLVHAAGGDKPYDGTTATTLVGLKGNPADVTLVAGPGASANFDSPEVGINRGISFTGYTLAGSNAGAYALPFNCCGPVTAHTTGTITAAVTPPPVIPPPVTPPPPVIPPPVTPPPVTPPGTPVTPPGTPVAPPVTPPGIVAPILTRPPNTRPPVSVQPPGSLVTLPPEAPPGGTLTITEQEVAEEENEAQGPYVAPVRKPKPYRN